MLEFKFIRENTDKVKESLKNRNVKIDVDKFIGLDEERRKILVEVEELKCQKNVYSKKIGETKKKGGNADKEISQMKASSDKIKELDGKVTEIEKEIQDIALQIPNIPHPSIPVGPDPSFNKVVSEHGKKPKFDFKIRPHWDIGDGLGILDMQSASKIAGSGFAMFKGAGAKLVRALINFMLDVHTQEHGFTEIWPPALVNRESMTNTGQLPKLEEDMYRCDIDDLFLVPTAEVPITNIHMNDILKEEDLPVFYTAYSPCFRREAGSYGKDTRGLLRVHQFDKVELVKFVKPETSYDELESLRECAEEIIKRLGLHYRVIMLCTGDISFAATKCYDIEVWAPAQKKYLECSSCSNFEDFQARRAKIRYRYKDGSKAKIVHTLNGSGVALARTIACILETYQNADGSVTIPEALRSYMGGADKIS